MKFEINALGDPFGVYNYYIRYNGKSHYIVHIIIIIFYIDL